MRREIEMEKVQQTIRAPRGTELQTKGWVQCTSYVNEQFRSGSC